VAQPTYKILFVTPSPEYLRYYDSTIRLLADRGHRVSLAIGHQKEKKHARLDGLVGTEVRFAGFLPKRTGLWRVLSSDIRGTMDFLRYLDPDFVNSPALRDRMKRKALPWFLHGLDRLETLPRLRLKRALGWLAAGEAAVPCQRGITAFLAAESPDLLVVSPLVEAGSDQVELIKSARRLGIPAAVGIASWDNLTNKGLLRVQPDALLVWNDAQKREAVELHGVDPARVVTTGAQPFDRWFDREPSRSREEFCRAVGLPPDRKIVLFTGSSVSFGGGWLRCGRARAPLCGTRRFSSARTPTTPISGWTPTSPIWGRPPCGRVAAITRSTNRTAPGISIRCSTARPSSGSTPAP
jgi:hypothetical protein